MLVVVVAAVVAAAVVAPVVVLVVVLTMLVRGLTSQHTGRAWVTARIHAHTH